MSLLAIVHIGSAEVSGGLWRDGEKVFLATRECRFQEKLDTKTFLAVVAESLKSLMTDLLGSKQGNPERVVVFLASPFVAGRLNLLRHAVEKTFAVTEKLVADLVAQEIAKLKNNQDHELVDSKIMRFRLNGYAVEKPHGQRVASLEVAHYLSIAAREAIGKFRDIIRGACHHDKLEFHASSFAAFTVLRHERPQDESFILVDVGGEITELTLIWRGIIRETLSYPTGSQSLLRERVTKYHLTPAVARSTLEAKEGATWLQSFNQGLKQILAHRFWSGEIILLVEDQLLAPIFQELLGGVDLGKMVFSAKKPEINLLRQPVLLLEADFMLKLRK